MRAIVRKAVIAITALHGLVHLMGVTRESLPWLWLLAGVAMITTAVLMVAAPRTWWRLGAVAVVVSQVAIVTSWDEAWAGTIANVIIGVAVAHAFATEGPWGLRRRSRRAMAAVHPAPVGPDVTDADVDQLPAPLALYLRRAGAVGQPRPVGFRATIAGRIRGGADAPWMPFTGEQVNTFGPRWTRAFFIDATMHGMPADVFHLYDDGTATMDVRGAGVLPIVHASGPELDRAETATVFNDLCVLAPAALLDAPVQWESVDDRTVRGTFRLGAETVTAELRFDDDGDLVDFVTDDRLRASADGRTFTRQRWSTPLYDARWFGRRRLPARGEALWHAPPPEATFSYLEFEVVGIADLGTPDADSSASPASPAGAARAA